MKEKKIAYLIQAYSDYKAFKKLVEILLSMDNCDIFVHLDAKSDLRNFYINDERVFYLEKREFVSWAGYAQGKLIFNLIEESLKNNYKYDYFCFISESDFPVFYGEKLYEKLINSKIKLFNCTKYQPEKIERYWFYDYKIKSPNKNKIISKAVNTIFGFLYKIKIVRKDKQVYIDGKLCDVYMSGPFWCLSYDAIKYVNDVFKRNIEFQKYFKYSFASCELMVSTILGNSKYNEICEVTDEYINLNNLSNMCFFRYTGPRVDVLNDTNYSEIIESGKPFIRKVKEGKSDELIKMIKKEWN